MSLNAKYIPFLFCMFTVVFLEDDTSTNQRKNHLLQINPQAIIKLS